MSMFRCGSLRACNCHLHSSRRRSLLHHRQLLLQWPFQSQTTVPHIHHRQIISTLRSTTIRFLPQLRFLRWLLVMTWQPLPTQTHRITPKWPRRCRRHFQPSLPFTSWAHKLLHRRLTPLHRVLKRLLLWVRLLLNCRASTPRSRCEG